MIDVPGFDDTHRTDGDVFRDIPGWLVMAYEKNINLSGIIYLQRMTHRRLSRVLVHDLDMFKELCSCKAFSEVTLVSTWWDSGHPAIDVAREHDFVSNERIWGSMVKQGSRVARHSHSRHSAMRIVDSIVERQRTMVLEIQDEMVNRRLRLDETAAGRFMSRELLDQRNKMQEEIQDLQDRLREAVEKKNEDGVEYFALYHGELQERMDRQDLDQQIRNLRVSFENLKWERERESEKIRDEGWQRIAGYVRRGKRGERN